MKRGNLKKWKDIDSCKNLLFFSQLVNELLFDYSIPSNRISTLNSHYLCLDAISTIDGIEHNGIHEGTLKPVVEELYSELKKDPVFNDLSDGPIEYFVKYQGNKYVRCSKISDIGVEELKNSVRAIRKIFFSKNNYYDQLRSKITSIIINNKEEDQLTLFRLTKSLLTELMNCGYSLKYLYIVMDRLFWNPSTYIESSSKIQDFFNHFNFNDKKYTIVLKGNKRKLKEFVAYIDGLSCNDKLPDDLNYRLGTFAKEKSDKTFLIVERKDLDPYSAAGNVIKTIELNMAVYRLYNHFYRYHIASADCIIFDENKKYIYGHRLKGVEHTKTPPSKQISESMDVVDGAMHKIASGRNYQDLISIISAIEYHSHSLDSQSDENQLLDLWSIFESVLDISNAHTSDRIQQVCVFLVPLLKQKYIYSLFKQLSDDIYTYDDNIYNSIIEDATEESEIINKVCRFTLLHENEDRRKDIISKCSDFPLLTERINYYNDTLSTPAKIYSFVEKHADRVRWQIMRIYRNRNMIVHNGSTMPYLPLLIENLHSYVDDFISYTIHSMAEGKDINSMCQELFVKECKWNASFMRLKDPVNSEQIDYILSM